MIECCVFNSVAFGQDCLGVRYSRTTVSDELGQGTLHYTALDNCLSQIKNEQKLSKMVHIIPNFLGLHFGENFMKIWTKIAKLQMHENLPKNVNENMFSFTVLCKFSCVLWRANKATNMLQLYAANFNPFKMAVQYKFSPESVSQIVLSHDFVRIFDLTRKSFANDWVLCV